MQYGSSPVFFRERLDETALGYAYSNDFYRPDPCRHNHHALVE